MWTTYEWFQIEWVLRLIMNVFLYNRYIHLSIYFNVNYLIGKEWYIKTGFVCVCFYKGFLSHDCFAISTCLKSPKMLSIWETAILRRNVPVSSSHICKVLIKMCCDWINMSFKESCSPGQQITVWRHLIQSEVKITFSRPMYCTQCVHLKVVFLHFGSQQDWT